MTLLDLLRSPWAIQPDRLLEIQAIYATHLRGEKIDLPALEARLGRPLASEQQDYRIDANGIAVLPIEGVLAPKANLFMRISGGASTQLLTKQVESAIADPRVRGLILQVDSGGGSALGVPELADTIRELSAVKPIVTVTDGVMASGAYWTGSAANAVFASGPTVQVGSIGVVMTHNYTPNTSGQTTEITAGKYKRMATSAKPLDAESTAYLQQMADHIYEVFVDAVASNRGVSSDTVLEHMADGRVFIGSQAKDAGLIDGFATVDQVAERMAANPAEFATRRKAKVAASAPAKKPAGAQADGNDNPEPVLLDPNPETETQEGTTMDLKTLAEQHPELLATIQTDARAAGAQAEQARVTAVRAQSMKGHEALIEQLAADGKTTGPEAAMAVLAAERAAKEAAGKAFVEGDAPKPANTAAAPSDTVKTPEVQAAEAKAYAKEKGVSIVTAFKDLGFAA